MIKRLKYIFIPVLAILLMSHNVFAVDMSPNVHPIWTNANPTCSFYNTASNQWINNSFSNNSSTQDVTYSIGQINCDYPSGLSTKNTYAVYTFSIDNFNYNDSADSGLLAVKARKNVDPADFGVIGVEVSAMGSTGYQFDIYLYGETANLNGGTIQIYNPLNADEIFYLKPKERVTFVGASYWQVTTQNDFEYDYTSVLNSISSKLTELYNRDGVIDEKLRVIRNSVQSIDSKIDDIAQDTADAINDGQADATQDAADDSSTAGNTSSSDAVSATSSLLSVIGAGIGAITSAQPTNCRINGNMGNLDVGTIDLCGNPVPTFVGVIGSIIAVLVVLPLVIVLFNRFISIIRSFQS